jgi:HlyD family secretion protein
VAASLQTPTLFSIARDLTQMQIEASIDEADIGRIEEGQKAICKFDAWPKLEFEGTVTQVRLAPEIVSNVAAALRFSPPADAIPPKETAESARPVASPIGIPRFPRGSRNGGVENAPLVWLVENGRLAGSLSVEEQGLSDRTWVEVLNSPLKEGQELAVSYAKEDSVSGATFAGTNP